MTQLDPYVAIAKEEELVPEAIEAVVCDCGSVTFYVGMGDYYTGVACTECGQSNGVHWG